MTRHSIDWDKLKSLYYVVKCGSFTKAAEKLGVCQSAVSRQIHSLESRLKHKVFKRDGSRILITDAGAQMFDLAESIMTNAKAVINSLDDTDAPTGEIVMVSNAAVVSALVPQYMLELSERYPGLHLHLRASLSEIFLEECDVAICGYLPNRPDLQQEPLFKSAQKLFASPEYIQKCGTPKRVSDLENHRLLSYSHSPDPHNCEDSWLLTVGLDARNARKPFATFNSSFALLNAASNGLGIVELEGNFPGLMGANLVEVLPELRGPETEMFVISHKKAIIQRKVSVCVAFLKEKLSQY
ncbi:MAG: LysR family transcriptional regulator [Alphaproteobacteria bacterium]|nr:MAG: LysR family transcriptional regulator [Alphaproteobacteria bacterium]